MTKVILIIEGIMTLAYFICLIKKNKLYETIPQTLQQMGLLGTFMGIAGGLRNFNETSLEESIMVVLGGMSTALITSIVAIGISMILGMINKFIKNKDDDDALLIQAKSLAEMELLKVENTKLLKEIESEISMKKIEYDRASLANDELLEMLQNQDQIAEDARVKTLAAKSELNRIVMAIEGKMSATERLDKIMEMKNEELRKLKAEEEEAKRNIKRANKLAAKANKNEPKKSKGLFGWW